MKLELCQDRLIIPTSLLETTGLCPDQGLLLTLLPEVGILTNIQRSQSEQELLAMSLREAAKSLEVSLDKDGAGLNIPSEMLKEAGIGIEDELDFFTADGLISINRVAEEDELDNV